MKLTGIDEIAEEGLTTDTGFRYYNRDKSAYIQTGAGGFVVTGTFTGSGFATGFTVQASTNLAKGDAVYISSTTAAGVPIVAIADADSAGKAAQFVVTDAAILSGAQGTAAVSGLSAATLNTNAATVGDPVYLTTTGTTTNTWTLTAPTASNAIVQKIGQVNVKSATVGQISYNLIGDTVAQIGSNELQPQSVTLAKMARGTNGQLIIGQTGADPAYTTVSGDVTIDATGATAIGATKVTNAMLAATAVTPSKIAAVGPSVVPGAIPAGAGAPEYTLVLAVPDAATGNQDFTTCPFKFAITRVDYIKIGAGNAGNSIAVHNGTTGNAITDAMNNASDKGTASAATIDTAFNTIAAGTTIRCVTVRAGGSNQAVIALRGHIST